MLFNNCVSNVNNGGPAGQKELFDLPMMSCASLELKSAGLKLVTHHMNCSFILLNFVVIFKARSSTLLCTLLSKIFFGGAYTP